MSGDSGDESDGSYSSDEFSMNSQNGTHNDQPQSCGSSVQNTLTQEKSTFRKLALFVSSSQGAGLEKRSSDIPYAFQGGQFHCGVNDRNHDGHLSSRSKDLRKAMRSSIESVTATLLPSMTESDRMQSVCNCLDYTELDNELSPEKQDNILTQYLGKVLMCYYCLIVMMLILDVSRKSEW